MINIGNYLISLEMQDTSVSCAPMHVPLKKLEKKTFFDESIRLHIITAILESTFLPVSFTGMRTPNSAV